MASNFFGLLEDVSSNDPVEIAKKRQQEAAVAKKNAEKKEQADKQAQTQKDQQTSSAKKTTDNKKPSSQRGGRPQQASREVDGSSEGFEQRDNRSKRGGRGGRGAKHHVAPKSGRPFDKPSHSGTGRGKEVAKGGSGGRNWGKPGSEVDPQEERSNIKKATTKKTVKVETESETPATPVDEEKKETETGAEQTADKTEETKQQEEEEEEDTSITYDKLLAEKKKAKNSNKPKGRKAGEGIATDPSLLKGEVIKKDAGNADIDLPIQGLNANPKNVAKKTSSKKKEQSADTRVGLGEFFKNDKDALDQITQAQQYKPQTRGSGRGGRGRGGRGNSRGGRGGARGGSRGGKSNTPSFNSADFPTLSK